MIACERTDRNFIGCEIDEIYYNKSLERYKELAIGATLGELL